MTRPRLAVQNSQTTPTPEEQTFEHRELVQFSDGYTAFLFRTPKDRLSFGAAAKTKFTHSGTHMSELAIARTASGNTYFLGNGGILNTRTGKAYIHPSVVDITIGEPSVIEGVGTTSAIQEVAILSKFVGNNGKLTPGAIPINAKNPFEDLAADMYATLMRAQEVGATAVNRV